MSWLSWCSSDPVQVRHKMAMLVGSPVRSLMVIALFVRMLPVMAGCAHTVKMWDPMTVVRSISILLFMILLRLKAVVSQTVIIIQMKMRQMVCMGSSSRITIVIFRSSVLVPVHVGNLLFGFPCWRCNLVMVILVMLPMRHFDRWQIGWSVVLLLRNGNVVFDMVKMLLHS